MQWSEIMEQVYQFWGRVAETVTVWWAQLELWSEQLLHSFVAFLAQMGVPQHQQLMVAYGCLFAVATLLVLLFVWRIARRRRQQFPQRGVEPDLAEQESEITLQPAAVEPEPVPEPLTLYERMKNGLSKTQAALIGQIDTLFSSSRVDDLFLEELEEILITADFGMKTTQLLIGAFKERVAIEKATDAEELRALFKEEILHLMSMDVPSWNIDCDGPFVLLVIGVNGVGKTTTIGKLAQQFTRQGKKVILGAADTFRAAAADQLEVWGERTGVTVVRHDEGSDPAAVAFDAVKAAVARKADILILDTAGRLHTKVNLMEEMKKIYRVLGREVAEAPHETLLVLDATTGQNALVQARLFQESVGVTGVAITKLDGTAKGGMAVAIGAELGLPVRYVGIGEGVDDLRPFDAQMFVDALFENR
ncbi:MAG: signal recognition particle-docking protein FtsY [Desulfobacteraceae bacterium 4572_35.1]|nr:MAG: signal recognition particle-docking protein FtsY [Desulfobacteraceae bacterium 4572_35.1]